MKIKNMVMMSKNNGQYRNIRALTGNTAFSNNVRKSFAIGARKVNIATVFNSAITTMKGFILRD